MRVFINSVFWLFALLFPACQNNNDHPPSCGNALGVSCSQSCGNDALEVGELCLSAQPFIDVSLLPIALATGDINRDGLPDLVSANHSSANVSVLLNTGNGNFSRPLLVHVGGAPNFAAVADVNGDEDPDIIVSDNSPTVRVLLGHGDGQFQSAIPSAFLLSGGVFKVADVDRDGFLDLIGHGFSSGMEVVLLGNGDGSFGPVNSLPGSTGTGSFDVIDIDNNGALDIISSGVEGGFIRIWLGAGDGSFFTSFDVFQSDHYNELLAAGDFNEDGISDFVLAEGGGFSARVMLGRGDNSFLLAGEYPTVGHNLSLFVKDINADNHQDLVVVASGESLQILLGDGTGSFGAPLEVTDASGVFNEYMGFLAAADFDGDGFNDIAAQGTEHARLFFGDGSGLFPTKRNYMLGPFAQPLNFIATDLNHDTNADLLMVNPRSDNVGVMLGDGKGSFTYPSHYPVGSFPVSMDIADINEDGHQDAVTVQRDETVNVLFGDGSGAFLPALSLSVDDSYPLDIFASGLVFEQVFVRDVNGDSHQDIIELSDSTKVLHVFLGNGSGSFENPLVSQLEGPIDRSQMKVVDFNADQKLDLAIIEEDSEGIRLFFGNESGRFSVSQLMPLGKRPVRMETGDVNSDNELDLVFSTLEEVCVLPVNGSEVPRCVSSEVFDFALSDINNDSMLDVISVSDILLGHGDGSFSESIVLPDDGIILMASVVVADFNSDQRADLFLSGIFFAHRLFLSVR